MRPLQQDEDKTPFFRLPIELRLAMYEAMLLSTEKPFAFLETCHQVNTEAQQVLYRQPATFASQANFFAWIDRSTVSNLGLINILRLTLTDIDLSPLVDPMAFLDASKRITIWQLCSSVVRKLEIGLRALPNLTSLTIIPPERGQPAFWQAIYHPILKSIRATCPKLKRLEIHDDQQVTDIASDLKQVPELIFAKRMPRPTLEEIDGKRKAKHGVAVVDFAVLLGIVHEGRRATSAPAKLTKAGWTPNGANGFGFAP